MIILWILLGIRINFEVDRTSTLQSFSTDFCNFSLDVCLSLQRDFFWFCQVVRKRCSYMEPWKLSKLSPLSLPLSSSISSTLFCSHFRCRKNWESIPVEFLQLYARPAGEGEGVGPPVLLEFGEGGVFPGYLCDSSCNVPTPGLVGWLAQAVSNSKP